ncbi:MAG TPA: DUF4468 domain-containing protein [Flavobacterium lutivivi]|nr:DUF4468 domain-containing protein [Flavobacterium lutivivi]
MKKLILFASIIFICAYSYSQKKVLNLPFDSVTNKISYSEVIFVDSLASKQELFSRAREWFAKAYKSSTNVIQMEDKESGKIVGKALMEVFSSNLGIPVEGGYMNYTISIYLKDGRYKYEITDFYHTGKFVRNVTIPDGGSCEKLYNDKKGVGLVSYKNSYERYLFQLDENIISLTNDLKIAMTKKTVKNDNW